MTLKYFDKLQLRNRGQEKIEKNKKESDEDAISDAGSLHSMDSGLDSLFRVDSWDGHEQSTLSDRIRGKMKRSPVKKQQQR